MSYDHSMSMTAYLKPDVSMEQIYEALKPIMESRGVSFDDLKAHRLLGGDDEFTFDQESGELYLYTAGDVGGSYEEMIERAVSNLSALCTQPGTARLNNYSTADLENAITEFIIAPSPEAAEDFEFQQLKEKFLENVERFIGGDQVEQLEGVLNAMRVEQQRRAAPPDATPAA